MNATIISTLMCGATVLGAVALPAQSGTKSLSTARSAEADPGPAIVDGRIRLSLDEAIELALERNLALDVERYSRAMSLFGTRSAEGIYDLNLTGEVNQSLDESLNVDPLAGSGVVESETLRAGVGVTQLFPVGGTLRANLGTLRRDFSVQGQGSAPSSWGGTLDVGYTQPLLRNFGKLVTERNLLVARISSNASREQFENAVVRTIQEVENAYWTLTEAIAQVKVSEEGLKLARDLHDMNKIRVDVGTLAPLELVQSEVGIATREEEIIRTRFAVGTAEDSLRRLLNLDPGDAWSATIEPTTEAVVAPIEIKLEEAIAEALANRPEVAQQKLTIDRLELDAKVAANQLKPRLDLAANYGYNGFGLESDGYQDTLEQILDRELKGWSLGLTFAYPLQNRTAKAQKTIADLDLDRARLQLADLEQGVVTEVRQAVRNVETAQKAVESARVSLRLAEKNLDAERKRYENGLSTSFQVLEIQEDLTSAASREVAAVSAFRRSLADLYRVMGRLLDQSAVELTDDVARIEEQGAAR